MAIINIVPMPGDPMRQVTGRWRGTAVFHFDDGRTVSRRITAGSFEDWATKADVMVESVEARQAEIDAAEAVGVMTPHGQATEQAVTVAALYRAWREPDPVAALDQFSTIEDWRAENEHAYAQVGVALDLDSIGRLLEPYGLAAADWAAMRERFAFLSSHVATLDAFEVVRDSDPVGAE